VDNTPVKDCINTICGYAFFATKARPQLHPSAERTSLGYSFRVKIPVGRAGVVINFRTFT
jgi:hypothetical protein